MKLTARTVAALRLPPGKTDVIFFDEAMPGFGYRLRVAAGGKISGSWVAQYRHASARAGCCWVRRRCSVPSRHASWPRRRWAKSPTAPTRKPTSSIGAARTDRRSRPPSPIIWRSSSARCVGAPFVEKSRYLTDKRYFGPLHGLALDQITRADVASQVEPHHRGE